MSSQCEGAIDHRRKALAPQQLKRHPELQGIETPCRSNRPVHEIRNARRLTSLLIEIVGVHFEAAKKLVVTHQERRTTNRLPELLMEVHADRISLLKTVK